MKRRSNNEEDTKDIQIGRGDFLKIKPEQIIVNSAQECIVAIQQAKPFYFHSALTSLDLRGNYIGVDGASQIADSLKQNSTLTFLDLRSSNIGVEGASLIANSLKQNSTLTYLNLRNNQIGSEGASQIADSLTQNAALTSLNLRGNRIGVEGASQIADALKQNSTLTFLDLRSESLIANALKKNSTLTSLNLRVFQSDKDASQMVDKIQDKIDNNLEMKKKDYISKAWPLTHHLVPSHLCLIICEILCLSRYVLPKEIQIYLVQTILQFGL